MLGEETRHRLCVWHLEQNAVKNLALLRHDAKFSEKFNLVLKLCHNEEQFEREWHSMIEGYNLQENAWLAKLYEIRMKWCRALNRDAFSAGMMSTQRSESTNHSISFNSNKQTSLTQFFHLFDAAVERWRETEIAYDFTCSRGYPKTTNTHILMYQASKVRLKTSRHFN